jgi:DNA-directed RNA polymerase specialized sigma24 family protein
MPLRRGRAVEASPLARNTSLPPDALELGTSRHEREENAAVPNFTETRTPTAVHTVVWERAQPTLLPIGGRASATLGANVSMLEPAEPVRRGPSPMPDPQLVREFKKVWPTIEARVRRIARHYAASDQDANDIMHDVIAKALDGTRTWDRAKTSLFGFLRGAIRSEVSAKAKHTARYPHRGLLDDGDDLPSSSPNPEQLLALHEESEKWESLAADVVPELREGFRNDRVATAVIEVWLDDGVEDADEQVAILGLPDVEVWKARKRIKDRMTRLGERRRQQR